MACISKVKHDVSHCAAEKGLQIFYDDGKSKYTGYCFSCASKGLEAYVENPYSKSEKLPEPPKKKTKEEIQAEIDEVRALNYPDFSHRGIEPKYFKQSGLRMAFSEFDGKTPHSFNFPYTLKSKLLGYKSIVLNKKVMWSIGDIKGADLFNWEVAKKKGTKRLYITEGEWDCLALEQMLEAASKGAYKYAVVSVPHGVGSAATTIGRMRKEIEEIFTEVVLVFDCDSAGEKAVKEVQKILPSVLEAPHIGGIKDANEALLKGKSQAFIDFVMWKARKPPIDGVVTVAQAMAKGVLAPQVGLSYPWPTVTEIMYGQRFGEATCVAGGVGIGKCQGYDTPILMYDGSIKPVQDVVVGDLLMGDDSTPREVYSTVVGKDEMFKVIPVKGETYTFNKEHILAIYMTNLDRDYIKDADGVKHFSGCKSTITIETYLRSSAKFKANAKLYRVTVDFNACGSVLPIPPYILGVWLGDGSTNSPAITTKDEVIKEAWINWGQSIGCDFRVEQGKGCETIYLKTKRGLNNPALDLLKSMNLIGNKHIPQEYKTTTKNGRLELLAGILDTDGHLTSNCFDLVLKLKGLSEDVSFIAKSVGLYSKVVECKKTIKSLGFEDTYFRQAISGKLESIPTKLRIAAERSQIKDVLFTGFTIAPAGVANYYGFEISGNRLYVLGDFIVTHNTAILHECAAHNIALHKQPTFLILLEEDNVKTCWNIAGKIDSLQYNRPEVFEANKERYYETMKMLEDKLFMWNSDGSTGHRFDLPEIISAIRFNNAEYGCRFFDIDNITRIIATLSSSEANEFVNKYSSELANLACELDVHIRLYSHLNVPASGTRSHEEGGAVYASQLTGSRGIMRFFPNVIGFERNKMAEGDLKSNSYISILKNRDYGNEQKVKTQYSKQGRLLEYCWEGDSLY